MIILNGASIPIYDKHTGDILTHIATARADDMATAIAAGHLAIPDCRALPAHTRQGILTHIATGIREKRDLFANVLMQEAGKTRGEAEAEVSRATDTFTIAAEEAVRLYGETLPMDRTPRGEKKWGFTRRFPIGLCALIAPFNFPLNLAAHKIAPAIAAGCPFILKPASVTPLSALLLGEILANSALPVGSWAIMPSSRDVAELLITDPRIALVSFTGSSDVGWGIKERAGKKHVILELGGNAACIIDDTADLSIALPKVVQAAFAQAGQSCISVQRVLLHEHIFEYAIAIMAELAKQTKIGPVISEAAAVRIETWIQAAIKDGAMCHCGGTRSGRAIPPTILSQVSRNSPLYCQEAFGPVMVVSSFSDFESGLAAANASPFGLQAGVFTQRIDRAHQAWDILDVGGVIINEAPSLRFDHMPYGGVKDSGLGKEGIRYALRDYTIEKIMVI